MTEASLEEIRNKAKTFYDKNIKWHFHILTPTCHLNETTKFAFILEGPDETYVYYSDKAEKGLGKELVPLLHGDDVSVEEAKVDSYQPSAKVLEIIESAKNLNDRKEPWHHHVLFPECIYNKNSPSYTLIFEGAGKTIENVTDDEPKGDIKLIEPLFFKSI